MYQIAKNLEPDRALHSYYLVLADFGMLRVCFPDDILHIALVIRQGFFPAETIPKIKIHLIRWI